MTNQNVANDQMVRVPRYAFEALAAYTALNEDKVAVMLLLLMRMDSNRAVSIDTTLLPDFLTVREERVHRAISSLIEYGWVESVDENAMRLGVLKCVVHSAFTDSDFQALKQVLANHRFSFGV
ncbi:hypothetical protein DM819_09485 [Pseudomonas hunanensis]|uniref:MarR family transcriptional regulator n=1 Tax=Pseudomonas hunanensis TaxID=1247546 RepID=A0ABD6MZW5_9PSED|nr:hypothetical protein [Pseudomonas hunanensis]NWL46078.1 hypothetical protein [Pseudomonas hunanensis]